jgi:hypothetical protein
MRLPFKNPKRIAMDARLFQMKSKKSTVPTKPTKEGGTRSHIVGLLAGIGLASIAIFTKNTAESAMSFVKELRKDGYATTASASINTSGFSLNTSAIPLPQTVTQRAEPGTAFPHPVEESEVKPTVINTSLQHTPVPQPQVAVEPPHPPTPPVETKSEQAVAPAPAFDSKALQKALHDNLASVFTGDLPYILLKSGDRLYAGSKLTEGVTLEAISPNSVYCATPAGILKLDPQSQSTDAISDKNEDALPLDPPKPLVDPQNSEPASDPSHQEISM